MATPLIRARQRASQFPLRPYNAWDTRRIAEATVEQRNLTHRPCVVFAGLGTRGSAAR